MAAAAGGERAIRTPAARPTPFQPVDREKTCPLLLRVFTTVGEHHKPQDFAVRGKEPAEEVQIYTWKDATLRELADLVKEVVMPARKRNAKLSFAFVYPGRRGNMNVRQVGVVHSYGKRGEAEEKMLQELDFQIGDFLDVAILALAL